MLKRTVSVAKKNSKFEVRDCEPEDIFVAGCNLEFTVYQLVRMTRGSIELPVQPWKGRLAKLYEPIVLNAALCTELYLKCLLLLDKGGWTNGHDHVKLFNELSEAFQFNVRSFHEHYLKTDPEQIRRAEWNKDTIDGTPPPSLDFDSQLAEKRDAFIYMRYWFENPDERLSFQTIGYPDTVALSLRHIIAKIKPEWKKHLSHD